MTRLAVDNFRNQDRVQSDDWKKALSETFFALQITPERFNGKVVISFKEGGISYLEKTETFK